MSWSNQDGGGGPWGGGGGQGPWGRGPGGSAPDLEEMLRKGQDRLKKILPGGLGGKGGIAIIVLVVLGLWGLTGFYRVLPDEQGVVLRFGEFVRTASPGLNYHFPSPIESVQTPKVTQINTITIGFVKAVDAGGRGGDRQRDVPEESLMLTGDQNIIDIHVEVLWRIKSATDYLFEIRDPRATVKLAAESAMREIIGDTQIQEALTGARDQIEVATRKLLQEILDDYKSGIEVTLVKLQDVRPPPQVVDAFDDVQRALQDKDRLKNEAESYRNDIIPRARGEAAKVVQAAEGYKREIVARAEGDAKRFISVYNEYKVAKEVTTQRLYLETMEEILRRTNKIIIDTGASGSQGVVPYLPLPEVQKRIRRQAK
ncbi:MAG: FtsH protease activity modulator HflK [Proteobacteria bacterium]|nr:FtsH protease activity modulator HflK [Pseudomonadota bacterium]